MEGIANFFLTDGIEVRSYLFPQYGTGLNVKFLIHFTQLHFLEVFFVFENNSTVELAQYEKLTRLYLSIEALSETLVRVRVSFIYIV